MNAQDFLGLKSTHNPHRFYMPVTADVSTPGDFLYGGAALAAGVTALQLTTGRPVVWATAHYLSYARVGTTVDIDVEVPVSGHYVAQARAVVHVDDKEIITVNAALGERPPQFEGIWVDFPTVPPPEACEPREGYAETHLFARIETRRVPWPSSKSDGRSLLWCRIPELETSTAALALAADLLASAPTEALQHRVIGTSLDNTVRVVRIVPTEWILCDMQVIALSNGFGHGMLRLWSRDGTLMATGGQSLIPRDFET